MPIHEYPYTDFHELNLDWIIKQMKELVDSWDSFSGNVSATAHESTVPEVTVEGDLKTELQFDFGLVKGNEGPRGPEGPEGPQGKGMEILGVYATLSDLQTAHPTGNVGDIYLVGTGGSYVIYVWNEDTSSWENGGPLTSPVPSSASPLMDGAASSGTALPYSREDHVHPSDTSKQDILVSGVNIKELNGYSLLGSGGISVQEPLVSGTNIKTINSESLLGNTDIPLQEPLVSGTNIKTLNGNDLLGSGDLTIQPAYTAGRGIDITGSTITNSFNAISEPALDNMNYYFAGYVVDATNVPTGVTATGSLIVLYYNGNTSAQFYTPYDDLTSIWMRKRISAAWQPWYKVELGYISGQTLTLSTGEYIEAGYCSGSSKTIAFTLHLDKPVYASSVTVNNLKLRIRASNPGGYIITDIDVANDGVTSISSDIDPSGAITFSLTRANVWDVGGTTVTNNTPVVVDLRGSSPGCKLTFN